MKLPLVSKKNEKIRKNLLTFPRNASCVDIRKQKSGNLNVDETEIRSQSFPQAVWNKTFIARIRSLLQFYCLCQAKQLKLERRFMSQVLVKNLHGTSDNLPPLGYSSWLEFWEQHTGRSARSCKHCGSSYYLVGAHVQKVHGSNEWYIVPLCSTCNHSDIEFYVDEYDLVPVRQ